MSSLVEMSDHTCSSLDEYLAALKAQVAAHGKGQLEAFDQLHCLTVGFKSPSGTWSLPLGALKRAFQTDTWRRNTELENTYRRMGGTTPLQTMTRTPPREELVSSYLKRVREAIEDGEKDYLAR